MGSRFIYRGQDWLLASHPALAGMPSDVAEKMKAVERENRELRHANEILHKTFTYFAMAEIHRSFKDQRETQDRAHAQ